MKTIQLFCPATVANISCGFDVLGLCLGSAGDIMRISKNDAATLKITQSEGPNLPLAPKENVAGVAAQALLNHLGIEDGFTIDIAKKIKPGSGIGSSAASAAGAVFGINELLGSPLSSRELIPFAMAGEALVSGAPHADNVAPALLGGITLIRSYDPLEVVTLPVPGQLRVVVIHPQLEVKTADARSVLRQQIPLKTAISQWGNLAALVSALYTEDYDLLSRCLVDSVAEPHRSALIPGFEMVKQAALEAGALGSGISGSGPSAFALCHGDASSKQVALAMKTIYQELDVPADVHISAIPDKGVQLITSPLNQLR